MSRWDDVKRLKDAAKAKLDEADLGKLAGNAVIGAQNLADGAEAVAGRSGLTKKNGELSKLKVARAAVQPRKTARKLLSATADEVRDRRGAGNASESESDPDTAG